jgi:chromosome segregation ATPase
LGGEGDPLAGSRSGWDLMAKSVEQRKKELVDSTTTFSLLQTWNDILGENPDLKAPIYRNQGDIAGSAKKYDDASKKFLAADKRKKDSQKLFEGGAAQLEKLRAQNEGLKKELDDIVKDEGKSQQTVDDVKNVDDAINNWEEALKAQNDLNKERKTIYDNMAKVGENYSKALTDTVGKVKKEVAAANADFASSNTEMNALEAQIRNTVVKYQKVALDSNKKNLADAVRGILTAFGK